MEIYLPREKLKDFPQRLDNGDIESLRWSMKHFMFTVLAKNYIFKLAKPQRNVN